MSQTTPTTSSSSLKNLITSTSNLPLFKAVGNLMTHTAAAFEYATYESPQARFTAVMIATMTTSLGIWGIQFTLGRIPFHFVRKTLIPVAEWSLKAGLAWVIFKALDNAVNEVNGHSPLNPHSRHPYDPEKHRRSSEPLRSSSPSSPVHTRKDPFKSTKTYE
ncbi:MAG: hypothetical protein KDK61_00575 [Simkania sp.]|uniref:Uncharacterized protein n=1 Tax=Simkania negevensis (strain ATCC VR-1471 / DSM 27360 / Z) TaxID=331113 RepID=F8L6F2_SIMNZ|nr:hypothetical protein [Simkania negevensis]MCB1082779.1 hypothetical protein [Simkania sp.]CCB88283.1 unknown protein [Simkania negevensis Z]